MTTDVSFLTFPKLLNHLTYCAVINYSVHMCTYVQMIRIDTLIVGNENQDF